jgi:hypothetical protein
VINKENNPVEWAMLCYELDDAREHLEELLKEMSELAELSAEDFEIQIGHIYAHLNRAWNSQNITSDHPHDQIELLSGFPTDLKPTGFE